MNKMVNYILPIVDFVKKQTIIETMREKSYSIVMCENVLFSIEYTNNWSNNFLAGYFYRQVHP